ncbi:MAG: LptE family protein [Pirellulales bacterium]
MTAVCRFSIRHTECAGYLQASRFRLLLVTLLLALGGCAPYRFGVRSLYPQDIETVHVPIFESDSFRRDLGEQLTEAVCKEIEKTTSYKIVGAADADSVLLGRLGPDTKKVLVETGTDEPRQLQINYTVQIRWLTRDQHVLVEKPIILPADLVTIGQAADFVPEVGQTYATQSNEAIQKLARQIVHLMEAPW